MKKLHFGFLFGIIPLLFIAGCRDDIDGYYRRPDYLRGNAYEFLTEKGNYTYFLQAAGKTGFKDALDGRGIYSVFAPDDEAFKRYLQRHGKSSLDEVNSDTLAMLVGFHMVEFAFNSVDFLAFSKSSSSADGKIGTGNCYRFKTLAREKPIMMRDPLTKRMVKVFQQERFLPVLSTRLFADRECADFEKDYKMFFPHIEWQGNEDKLYVGNAAVIESGIPIDNGYMYIINEVIEPLPTLYDELNNETSGNYKLFISLYDRFANMQYDDKATLDYSQLGDSLFTFNHYLVPGSKKDLPDLASHWTVSESDKDYETRMKYTYNCFTPTDNVLAPYLKNFFVDWENPMDIPLLSLYYLLNIHVETDKEIILPAQIDRELEGQFGEILPIKRKDLLTNKLCSNGILYGMNKVFEPAVFTVLSQPLFRNIRFSTMLNLAHKAGTFSDLIDPDREMSLFVIRDQQLKDKFGMYVDYENKPTSPDVIGERVAIKKWKSETDKNEMEMNAAHMIDFMSQQVVYGYVDLDRMERTFYSTQKPFRYIYTEGGQIYSETGTPLTPINVWKFEKYPNGEGRGVTYEMEEVCLANKENMGRALYNDVRFKKFYNALLKANLITLSPDPGDGAPTKDTKFLLDWLNDDRCMVFAPVNEAWDESRLPVDSLELDKFLKYHFVSTDENKINDYILPNYGIPMTLETKQKKTIVDKALMTINWVDDKRLRITNDDKSSNVMTDGMVPYFATDGLIYGIEKMITAKSN